MADDKKKHKKHGGKSAKRTKTHKNHVRKMVIHKLDGPGYLAEHHFKPEGGHQTMEAHYLPDLDSVAQHVKDTMLPNQNGPTEAPAEPREPSPDMPEVPDRSESSETLPSHARVPMNPAILSGSGL